MKINPYIDLLQGCSGLEFAPAGRSADTPWTSWQSVTEFHTYNHSYSQSQTIHTFHGRHFNLSKAEEAQVEFITLMMATFHLGEVAPGLWYCALSVIDMTVILNGMEPLLMLLITPVCCLPGSMKTPAERRTVFTVIPP